MTDPKNHPTGILNQRYLLHEEVGAGGMARVYRATDVRHGRMVAVKILRPEIATTVGRERFLREIRIISQLTHPNILPLHDSGESGTDLFYVMPFVDGRSLRDELTRATFLPIDDVVRYGSEIGDALDFAHAKGILHRDIKPENILIEAGHAILADFGIAKAILAAGGSSITDRRLAVGTAAYMSPEQGSGDVEIDGRSDLYSLAVVLFEMLAGCVPYSGPTPQAILARKSVEPMPSIRTIRPAVAPQIESVLRRGLSVVPADRYGTARELVRALRDDVKRPPGRRNVAWIATGALAAATALIAVYTTRVTPAPEHDGRVAVAEFINRTGDPALDAVGFMAVDWITEGLQRLSGVKVVPMPATLEASRLARNGVDSTPPAQRRILREETGATILVTGAFYRSGDSLLVQSQITDGRDGHVLVAIGPIVTTLGNPAAAVAELRTRTMGSIASLGDERVTGAGDFRDAPPTFEAYRAFSDGMSAYLASNFAQAAQQFGLAHERDPQLATPLLFASISLSNLGRHHDADSVARLLAGERDRLSPYYQDWLDYRLALLAGDRAQALSAIMRVADRAPGTKATYNLAVEAMENGHVSQASEALASLSVDKGPMRGWLPYWDLRGTLHHLQGAFNKELDDGAQAQRRYPRRLYALRSTIRSAAATARMPALRDALGRATYDDEDPIGTTVGSLLIEAAEESAAHGHQSVADGLWGEAATWFGRRIDSHTGTRADSLDAARTHYALGRWEQALRVLPRDTIDAAVLTLSGLIAVGRADRVALATALRRLEADRRPYLFGAPQLGIARIAARARDTTRALLALRDVFAHGKEYDLWVHRTPEFASLRNSQSFREVTRMR